MDIGRSFGMSLTGWDSLFGSLESEHSKRRVAAADDKEGYSQVECPMQDTGERFGYNRSRTLAWSLLVFPFF